MLGRSWFSFFRLLFKEHLEILTWSRSGENTFLHPTFAMHIDVAILGGAPIKEVGEYPIFANKYTNSNIFKGTMIDAL